MSSNPKGPDSEQFLDRIEQSLGQATEYTAFLRKLKTRLSLAKKGLVTKPGVARQVSGLIESLQKLPKEPQTPSVADLIQHLEDRLQVLRQALGVRLAEDLRHACEAAGMNFKPLSRGDFGVGPFRVTANSAKEVASLGYAKVAVETVPLAPASIVDVATNLKASLIDEPVDIAKVASQLEQAIRVALARQGKKSISEMRAELPAVFREMAFIKQLEPSTRRRTAVDYALPRFVVEIKSVLQSDQNLNADRQLRLETATLENANNPRRSIFVPNDLACGYGEGTFYQALLLRQT
jgi:hypothetical protein